MSSWEVGYGAQMVADHRGTSGGSSTRSANWAANPPTNGSNSGEWNPDRNGSSWAITLRSRTRSLATAIASGVPQITDWWGQLSWDTGASARPSTSSAATSAPQPSARNTTSETSMAPGRSRSMKSSM